ncbi:hypothetical protein DY218_14725 [Streptomyces triticagri]|uniref:Uncharacterized protein n=1 Tax=Streptomyces triticagri TaxID=2293568 RepID=A0A372M6M2_9ACTN|nr:hypothetical protein [Streptomyces triticagri]RFU85947.1 hypothetical protein DY218_14725 [Streptomyces triticagri]
MESLATLLRWAFLGTGLALMAAFAVTAVRRRRRTGEPFGELVEFMEREWFSAGAVFFAMVVGLAGSWAAAHTGGTRTSVDESAAILFPLGIVAAFTVCRMTRHDGTHSLWTKLVALVAAPLALGTVMTGW